MPTHAAGTHAGAYLAPAQVTVPTDRHPHSGHCSPPADVCPWAETQMMCKGTFTPSNPHGATCPPEYHLHTQSLCTGGFTAGVAGEVQKADSCSADGGLASSPLGFPKGGDTLTPVAGLLEELRASVQLQQISHQASRSLAQAAARVLGRRSLLPGSPSFWAKTVPQQPCVDY